MLIFRILGPIKFCKGPIQISNGPLKFGNLHVFEWDMGHWPKFKGPSSFWARINPAGVVHLTAFLQYPQGRSRALTHHRAIKEETIAINSDWVYNQA